MAVQVIRGFDIDLLDCINYYANPTTISRAVVGNGAFGEPRGDWSSGCVRVGYIESVTVPFNSTATEIYVGCGVRTNGELEAVTGVFRI